MNGFGRTLALQLLAAASRLLPPQLSSWSRAMNRELTEISDDGAALDFAVGCLRAALTLAITTQAQSTWARARGVLFPPTPSTWSLPTMTGIAVRPRLLGLLCGAGAVGLGMAYMLAAGAPPLYLLVNLAALGLGAAAWFLFGRVAGSRLSGAGVAVLALAALLLLTALFGRAVEGASRWVSVGPLSLQVSLVVLPLMIVLYARRPDAVGTAGMTVAALALALQPDRAMAGVLLAGLLGIAFTTPSRLPILATTAAALAYSWTLLTPDTLPAMPYVDRILYTAFDVHPLAGLAVVIGTVALVIPAVVSASRGAGERPALFAFGGCWAGVVVASALGNYPTPLVGYGGGAVLGYLLSVALLSDGAREASRSETLGSTPVDSRNSDQTFSELRLPSLA